MIYLDHHAATPLCEAAVFAMNAARQAGWANPSSIHALGRESRSLLERARDEVARALGARPADVVFTSGGTEACNTAVLGLSAGVEHVITTDLEHPAIVEPVSALERRGVRVTRLVPTSMEGLRELEDACAAANERTLFAAQWVNHETGMILPIPEWAARFRARGARVLVDATQAFGKLPFAIADLDIDALVVAAHKMGGPAGAGAFWLRPQSPFDPYLLGGGQERGRRAGTPDVVVMAGFGAACAALPDRLSQMAAVAQLRDRLEAWLVGRGAVVNGVELPRVSTVTNVSFQGLEGLALVIALDLEGICASSGPACSSGLVKPSSTVRSLYKDAPWRAETALRLSFGPEITPEMVDQTCEVLGRVLERSVGV